MSDAGAGAEVAGFPRIRELTSPGLQIADALHRVVVGATVGGVVTFALVLVFALLFEELGLAAMLGFTLDFDALFRSTMLPVLICWGATALLWPATQIARHFALFGAVRDFIIAHPDDAPPREVRARLRSSPAKRTAGSASAMMMFVGVVLVLCVIMVFFMAGEGAESFLISLGILVVVGALFALAYLAYRYGRGAQSGQQEWADAQRARFGRIAAQADAAEKKRRSPRPVVPLPPKGRSGGGAGFLVLAWMLMIGFGVFFLAVVMRQPCRGCDQVTWGPAGEGAIDLFSGSGGVLLTLFGALCAVLWLLAVARTFVAQRRIRRWVTKSGEVRVADDDRLSEMLALPDAFGLLSLTLAGFGTMVLLVAGGVAMIEWEGLDASIALVAGQALLFASVLIGLLAERRTGQFRMLLRDALLPGDLPAGAPAAEGDLAAEGGLG